MQKLLIDPQLVRALAEVYGRTYQGACSRLPHNSGRASEARSEAGDAVDSFLTKLRELEHSTGDPA